MIEHKSILNDDKIIDDIFRLIDEKYDGDLRCYDLAEKEVMKRISRNNSLIDIRNSLVANRDKFNETDKCKYTRVDLINDSVDIEMIGNSNLEPILAYSYEYMTTKRLFPFSLNLLFDNAYGKDKRKAKSVDEQTEAARILTWAKSRILNTQFQVNSLSIDRKDGILTYNTTTRDSSFGATLQYITAKIDKNKLVTIENLGIKKPVLDISRDYNTLFTYFIMFGFTEFYARCTCSDYYSKYSKKRGIQNYFCSHILYSMAQFPWYASTYLAN